ncbi:MAG: hypothetical protein ACYDHM_03585 [Acidiferrobacterales bacterium]
MKRRLYFLLPDIAHARLIVADFEAMGIARQHIHAVGHDVVSLQGLESISMAKDLDRAYWLEWWWWRINLTILLITLLALVASLLLSTPSAAFTALAVITVTCILGVPFAMRIPNVHLGEFQSAIVHGGIVIMTDMHRNRIAEIEDFVRRRHPEATQGGVCWMTPALQ